MVPQEPLRTVNTYQSKFNFFFFVVISIIYIRIYRYIKNRFFFYIYFIRSIPANRPVAILIGFIILIKIRADWFHAEVIWGARRYNIRWH